MKISNQILWDIFNNLDCSRTEFSLMLGYKKCDTNVSMWLNDRKDLSLDQLEKICNKLKIKLNISIEYGNK